MGVLGVPGFFAAESLVAHAAGAAGPIISNVSIKSNSAKGPTRATLGDIITLTFTTDEPVTKLGNFKINSSNPDTFTNVGNNYTATHLVDSGDPITGVPATFQINVKNATGIFSLTVEATNDGSSVTIVASPVLSAEDFGVVNFDTGLGILKGYSAGFGLTGATFASSSVVMQLFASSTLLQTNSSTLKVGNVVTGVQISSPFDVSGNFDYVADGFWVNHREAQFGQSVAANRVVATVTLSDGTVLTAENDHVTGDPTTIFAPVLTSVTVTPATSTIAVKENEKSDKDKKDGNDGKDGAKNKQDGKDGDKNDNEDNVSSTVQLTATDFDQFGVMFVGATTTFSSSNPAVATVNSMTGLVTGVSSGTVMISATSVSGTITVTGTALVTVVKEDKNEKKDDGDKGKGDSNVQVPSVVTGKSAGKGKN
jgi:hypothetical protein